jgi:hypothetical protein
MRKGAPPLLDRPLSKGRSEVGASFKQWNSASLGRAGRVGRRVCAHPSSRLAQVSLSAFAFLFSELVQYCQQRVSRVTELENRLEEVGFRVGERVLELCCYREKVPKP